MFLQALDVSLDRLADVFGRLDACLALRDTAWKHRTGGYEYTILILFQNNPIFHHAAILREPLRNHRKTPATGKGWAETRPASITPFPALCKAYDTPA